MKCSRGGRQDSVRKDSEEPEGPGDRVSVAMFVLETVIRSDWAKILLSNGHVPIWSCPLICQNVWEA